MKFESHGAQHIGHRAKQQDSFRIDEGLGLFVVADGMGGRPAGEVASRLAVDVFHSQMQMGFPSLLEPFHQANQEVYMHGKNNSARSGMGTTFTALHLCANGARWIHVGDTRLYRLRRRRLQQLTDDHHLDKDHSVLYRVLGVGLTVEPDYPSEFQVVEPDDVYLLCSDGLTHEVRNHHIQALLQGASPGDAVMELMSCALRMGEDDNITVVVVKVLSR